jgi:transcriptional regulator with XRE-family HTH domain
MKKINVDINFKEVTRRIEKEMEGYSRTAWAEKVGVKINVVSNIHSANAKQSPSLNYILAVSVATRKPMDYFLWGRTSYQPSDSPVMTVKEDQRTYSGASTNNGSMIPAAPDLEMGKRVRYWREDMGLSIAEVSKRTELPINLIESIENGHHTRTDVMVKLADVLRCSIDFLLGCGGASVVHQRRIEKRSKSR